MTTNATLKTEITADNKKFIKATMEAKAEVKRLSRAIQMEYGLSVKEANNLATASFKKTQAELKKTTSLTEQAVSSFKAFGAALVIGTVVSTLADVAQGIDDTIASANKLDIATRQFQAMQYAAKQTDTELSTLETSLKKLRTNIAQATPGQTIAGIDVAKLKAMDLAEANLAVADSVKAMNNQYAQTKAVNEAYGAKGGQEMLNYIRGGGSGFQKEFLNSGKGLSAADEKTYSEFDEASTRFINDIKDKGQQTFLALYKGSQQIEKGYNYWRDSQSQLYETAFGSTDYKGQMKYNKTSIDQNLIANYNPNAPKPSSVPNFREGSSTEQIVPQIVSLGTAAAAAAASIKAFDNSTTKLDDLLGLNKQSGKSYLASILKPQEVAKDERFTSTAQDVSNRIASGENPNSVPIQSGIKMLESIAREYKGQGGEGMAQAAKELKDATQSMKSQEKVVIELKYDQDGMVKAFIGSTHFDYAIAQGVSEAATREAQATGF